MRFKISKKGFTLLRDKSLAGFTLIDVLVGAALMLIVFLGIFGAYQLGLKVVGLSKTRIDATALANQQMEIIRNLPYESVGTKGASLPYAEGVLDMATTTVRNNIGYTVNIHVNYVVDDADGLAAPEDDCYLDYKRVEVRVFWPGRFGGEIKLVTDVVPKNKVEETNTCLAQPGGILSVNVFDAYGQMVGFPLIEIFNPETEEEITSYSPSTGKYDFPLATSTYKVVVSKSGYSSERTYGINEVATPEKPHPIVLEGQLTEISFSIDRLSTFLVNTLSPWGTDDFFDSFSTTSKIAESSNVVIDIGELKLAKTNGTYFPEGYLISQTIEPADIIRWRELNYTENVPPSTKIRYQVLYFDSENWVLVPDRDLPGNSAGLSPPPINTERMDPVIYPKIRLKATLSSLGSQVDTPILYDWEVNWETSQGNPIANVNFNLGGEKIIGYDATEAPIYKYSATSTSDADGKSAITNLEWDSYTFSVDPATGLDLVGIQPSPQPIGLSPDTTSTVDLYLEAENYFLLTVKNIETLEPIFAAEARLYNTVLGYDSTLETNEQGQVYFTPLTAADYNLEVNAPGYLATSTTASISGDTTKTVRLQRVE